MMKADGMSSTHFFADFLCEIVGARQDEIEGRSFWDLTSTVTLKKGFCDAPFASTDFGAAVALTLAARKRLWPSGQ
jgi:hypothetical protein